MFELAPVPPLAPLSPVYVPEWPYCDACEVWHPADGDTRRRCAPKSP